MAPAKRGRPAFSPPRPRKTTNTPASKSATSKGKATKSKAQTNTSTSKTNITGVTKKPRSKATESEARRRSRLVSPTPSASDSLGGDSNAEDGSMNIDEDDEANSSTHNAEDSPEPDYILAEVTHESDSSREPPIPLGLIHRILHSQFAEPEKTKISTDARDVVGKYVEVFVREAIMRCAYEKKDGTGGEGIAEQPAGGGWLELEDLEKVAVQLCLDF